MYLLDVCKEIVYSTTLAGSSSPHTNINFYNEGHITAAINVAECDKYIYIYIYIYNMLTEVTEVCLASSVG